LPRTFVILLLAAAVALVAVNRFAAWSYPQDYAAEVTKYAKEYDLPQELLYALIRTESGFDARAVSSADARGLTQITPETFRWLQTKTGENLPLESLFEPAVSVRYGAFFLRMLLDEFGETPTALAAYHAGRGQVNRWLQDPAVAPDGRNLENIPFVETKNYVQKVTKAQKRYQMLYRT
jgi:soluble lytic murein transglycosylase